MSGDSPLRNRVKELRSRLGLRQTDLADEIGVTRQTIIAIEKGRLNPSIVVSLKVARVLREPVDYVFFLNRDAANEKRVHRPAAQPKPDASRTQANTPQSPQRPAVNEGPKSQPEQSIWDF